MGLYFYYTTLFAFLQVFLGFFGILGGFAPFLIKNAWAEGGETPVVTEAQKATIVDHCDTIQYSLGSLQRADSRTRVYLGRYYETILTSFITPLNLRLVENNMSDTRLIENQTNFAARRTRFVNDYIAYQQALEELVNVNCKTEPEKFYEKLVATREKRRVVNRDVTRLREMTDTQVKLVEELKNGI